VAERACQLVVAGQRGVEEAQIGGDKADHRTHSIADPGFCRRLARALGGPAEGF